jgi:hypothetical protein
MQGHSTVVLMFKIWTFHDYAVCTSVSNTLWLVPANWDEAIWLAQEKQVRPVLQGAVVR